MTDKEFDSIIKDALTSEEVPEGLNQALFNKIKSRKKAKIIAFTKPASYVAAVFICAVAVLGYFNSDAPLRTDNIPERKEIQTVQDDKPEVSAADDTEIKKESVTADIITEDSSAVGNVPVTPSYNEVYEAPKKSAPAKKSSVQEKAVSTREDIPVADNTVTYIESESPESDAAVNDSVQKSIVPAGNAVISTDSAPEVAVSADTVAAEKSAESPETEISPAKGEAATEASTADAPLVARSMLAEPATYVQSADTLAELFTDGYDYKAAIDERVNEQISKLPESEEYTFSGISGEEAFFLSETNSLTINFDAGTIAPEEHGNQFFTVGTVENGVLE